MKKQYINFIKILSILLVICIHVISRMWNNYDINTSQFKIITFIDCLCRCAVPLFVMCSGAIFLNRDDSIKKIIFKYILRIYIIFILFNTMYQIIDFIMYKDGSLSINIILDYLLNSILLRSIYHLWYLKIVLIIYAFIPIFRYFIKKENKYIDNIILLILFITFVGIPLFISNDSFIYYVSLFGYLLYFYLGYYIEKYSNKKLLIPLFLISIIGFIYMYVNTINSNVKTENYMNYLSFSVVFISAFIYMLSKLNFNFFEKDKLKKVLNFQVKYNFSIYLIHGLVIGALSYINLINIYEYKSAFHIFLYVVMIYIVCFIISWIIYKLLSIIKSLKRV